ncbi:MAG: type II CAAX prenyl endopeptidase Rce1 family protein [Planctomycetota bacterium]
MPDQHPQLHPPEIREPDYWADARSPLASLCFLLPWLAIYEAGIYLASRESVTSIRNGADYWMRTLLAHAGAGHLVLPALVVAGLLAWHCAGRHPWRLRAETQLGMLAESLLLAIGLVALGRLHQMLFDLHLTGASQPPLAIMTPATVQAVTYVGAGVYEEVLFRLCLIPAACLIFRLFEFPGRLAAIMATLTTSFLFAIAHHIGPAADAFNLFSFSFRAAAGVFFAAVFLLRGFGITVGAHAAYDLLVGVLLAPPGSLPHENS